MARALTKGSKTGAGKALGLTLEGVNEVIARVGELSSKNRAFAEEVKRISVSAAMIVRDEARDLVPVDSGLLKSAIFAASGDKSRADALAGVSNRRAPHAHLIEYGTSRMRAQPFMRPAINYTRGALAVFIIDGFRRLLDKITK